MSDEQTRADIETVRQAIRHTGYAVVGGSWPAFERIVEELVRLRQELENADARLSDYEEAREVGE